MEVRKVIVHSIDKVEGQQQATAHISSRTLPLDDNTISLIEDLNTSYLRSTFTYAVFNEDGGHYFPQQFRQYQGNVDEQSFLTFTNNVTLNLRDQIQNIAPAKGGFLVYSEYSVNGADFFSVFLIRDTVGKAFAMNNAISSYMINPAEHLDLDKLAMASRINLYKYMHNDGRYLSVIKRRMPDISEYFINWISATNTESNTTITESLYRLVNFADSPLDEDGNQLPMDVFKQRVFQFISGIGSRELDLHELSTHFYGDENYLMTVAEQNDITIDVSFRPDKKILKKFISIHLDSDGIRMDFSRAEYMSRKIRIDEANQNVVIIESERFANDLRSAVEQ